MNNDGLLSTNSIDMRFEESYIKFIFVKITII